VIHTKNLSDSYRSFPKLDCGYCGNSSCISMLRRHCAGEASLSDCLFFKAGGLREADYECAPERPKAPQPSTLSFVNPCPSSPKLVTAEMSLAHPEGSAYGYFDMHTAAKLFGSPGHEVKVSPTLGLARMEHDGRAVMAFGNGRVLMSRALSEEDAFWHLSRIVRLLWAAVN